MSGPRAKPFSNSSDSPRFTFLGVPTIMRATGDATGGLLMVVEHTSMPPGFGSPYHTHHNEDEAFYILEGQVAFVCAGEWVLAGPGSFVYGPREIPHGFQVVGAVNARMLLMGLPGGFDKFVMELATPVDVPPSPPDLGHLVAVAAKYGIDIHGPLPEMPASITSA
jgi:mannose-6-phosphate isomerase-like protein (cupin superfamily)